MKMPVEEAVQQMMDLDVLGKIKYLLDQDKIHIKALDKLIKEMKAEHEFVHVNILDITVRIEEKIDKYLSAHQAVMEAREAGKCKA